MTHTLQTETISIVEMATRLGTCRQTAEKLLYSGKFRAVDLGTPLRHRWRINAADVDAFMLGMNVTEVDLLVEQAAQSQRVTEIANKPVNDPIRDPFSDPFRDPIRKPAVEIQPITQQPELPIWLRS